MGCVTRKETVDVIGDLIAAWELPFEMTSVVDKANGTYLVNVPKTYYLQKEKDITIATVKYQILSVVNNVSILLKGPSLPDATTFNLPVPYYFNGTILQTNEELGLKAKISEKTPMVYLRRPFNEKIDAADLDDTDTAIKADVTLYFLTEAVFKKWMTKDHDINAIKPMRNMMYEFVEMLKENEQYIERLTDYDAIDQIKFGIVTQNGVKSSLFSNDYSGVQMDITLGIKYQCIC